MRVQNKIKTHEVNLGDHKNEFGVKNINGISLMS